MSIVGWGYIGLYAWDCKKTSSVALEQVGETYHGH